MRALFIAAAAVLSIAVRPAQAQAVPDLNVDPVCRGIAQQAADPSEKGAPDLAFSKRPAAGPASARARSTAAARSDNDPLSVNG
jgi:hypothetical protein